MANIFIQLAQGKYAAGKVIQLREWEAAGIHWMMVWGDNRSMEEPAIPCSEGVRERFSRSIRTLTFSPLIRQIVVVHFETSLFIKRRKERGIQKETKVY
jgi:hypothetical protein